MSLTPRILVLGGTGFIGRAFIQQLLQSGQDKYDIFVLTRSDREAESGNVRYLQGDVLDLDYLENLFTKYQFDYIVHSVQFPLHPVERPWLGKQYTYLGCDFGSVDNVYKALCKTDSLQGLKQYIYISGDGVEDSDKQQYTWIQAKNQAEEVVKRYDVYTILRPSWVYGAGDRSMSQLISFAQNLPIFPMIGNGKDVIHPVYVDDLAGVLCEVLGGAECFLNTTIPVLSEPVTMREISEIILDVAGKPNKAIIPHPKLFMRCVGSILQFIMPSLGLSYSSVDFITMSSKHAKLPSPVYTTELSNLFDGLQKMLSTKL